MSSIEVLITRNEDLKAAPGFNSINVERSRASAARRVLINAARHIVGGYRADSPEERAVECLLKLAQEIPFV